MTISGCSREIDKVSDSDSLPIAPGPATDLSVEIGDRMITLRWQSVDDADMYLIYRSDSNASHFELLDSSETSSFADRGLQNGIRFFYEVSSVGLDGIEGDRSRSVSGVPGLFSIQISGGSEFTNNRDVSIISVFPNGTSHIMISNTSGFSGAVWETASEGVTWELPDQDGSHTVYAKFKMLDGNESSDYVSDDITLDRVAVIESLEADDGGSILSAGDEIHFRMTTNEAGGFAQIEFAGLGDFELFDNGSSGDPVADDGIYELDFVIPPELEFEDGVITGTFRDAATNQAPEIVLDHTISVRNAPERVTLFLNGAFEDRIELGWTRSNAADFASYRVYRSNTAVVTENSHFVTKLNSESQTTVTDTFVTPSEEYYYMVIVMDVTGLMSYSNILGVTTPDNEPPEDVVVAFEKTDSTSFRLTWTRNRDSDFESYRIYRSTTSDVTDNPADLLNIVNSQSTTSFSGDDEGETYFYRIYVYDRYGLSGTGSNIVPAP